MKPELDDTALAPGEPRTATAAGRDDRAVAAPGLASGQQLGHFRIERRIGAGGMGEVYLATDLALDRPVAVKVLPDELARDPRRRDRMVREARAQARVAHPNVGHIYFIGEEGSYLYFAMELVAGQTLAEKVRSGPLPIDDALAVIRAAALGLREAQRSGITHRDIKPSNLMIDAHGVVKVLDFGLASGDPGTLADGPVAQTSLAGTPLYMAPEQARGEAVDLRTDIYALGATLYHLVSGKPPFEADSVDQLLSLHATAARPAVPRRGVPRTQIGAIDGLITNMMAARPEDRFATYDDLLRAIELASSAHTRPAGVWARTFATGLDFVLLMIASGVFFMLLRLIVGDDLVLQEQLTSLLAFGAYQAFATARWGRTVGKAVFELEVVDVQTGQRPTLARSIRRAIAMLGVPTLALFVASALRYVELYTPGQIAAGIAVISGVVGMGLLVYASVRVTGKRAVWDRVSGTMVRYRTTRTTAH